MVHVLAPRPSDTFNPVFFNVDSPVGTGAGANLNRDDNLLVQFLLKTISTRMTTPAGLLIKPILADTPQTGTVDQKTIKSIKAFQGATNSPADGRVSSARGYRYGANYFTIVVLNSNVRHDFPQKWPRLDQIPNCPPRIGQLMKEIL